MGTENDNHTFLLEWAKRTGFQPPHNAAVWFGLKPRHFIEKVASAPYPEPDLRSNMASVAFTHTKQGWPMKVMVDPSYAPGFFWLGAQVQEPMTHTTHPRGLVTIWYPTVVSDEDLPYVLALWNLDKLRWDTGGSTSIWFPTWPVLTQCVPDFDVTYFAVSVDYRHLTVGRAYALPVGARKKVVCLDEEGKDQLVDLQRIGVCGQPLEKRVEGKDLGVVAKLWATGLKGPVNGVKLRNDNGQLWTLPKKPQHRERVLRRIAKMCAGHYRKWILKDKRNLLSRYVGE